MCQTLCDPIDGSPLGFSVPGILQARTLEWVAISFSNAWKWKVKVKSLRRVRLLVTPWTAAYQAPPSMDFPGKRTGVGCHCRLHLGSHRAPQIYYSFFLIYRFIVLAFRSRIHLKLTFEYGTVLSRSLNLLFFCMDIQLVQHPLLKMVFFLPSNYIIIIV